MRAHCVHALFDEGTTDEAHWDIAATEQRIDMEMLKAISLFISSFCRWPARVVSLCKFY